MYFTRYEHFIISFAGSVEPVSAYEYITMISLSSVLSASPLSLPVVLLLITSPSSLLLLFLSLFFPSLPPPPPSLFFSGCLCKDRVSEDATSIGSSRDPTRSDALRYHGVAGLATKGMVANGTFVIRKW